MVLSYINMYATFCYSINIYENSFEVMFEYTCFLNTGVTGYTIECGRIFKHEKTMLCVWYRGNIDFLVILVLSRRYL